MDLILTTLVIGLLAAAAKVIFLLKLGALRRVLAFDALLDVMAGSVFGFLFYGTLTGMVIASIATLAFSGFCYCWKRIAGYDRWTLGGFVHVPPTWHLPNVRGRTILAGLIIAGLIGLIALH